MSENKEFAYRAEVKYYDEKEKRNMIDFIFCVGPDNAEIDVLDLAYQRFCNKEPDLSKYEDKYVAIVDSQVVSSNKDPEAAYKAAKRKHPRKEVVLWKVPSGETFIF